MFLLNFLVVKLHAAESLAWRCAASQPFALEGTVMAMWVFHIHSGYFCYDISIHFKFIAASNPMVVQVFDVIVHYCLWSQVAVQAALS